MSIPVVSWSDISIIFAAISILVVMLFRGEELLIWVESVRPTLDSNSSTNLFGQW